MESVAGLVLRYNGVDVLADRDTEMASLTTMWRACGEPAGKDPYKWLRGAQAQEFMAALEQKLNRRNSPILQTLRGRDGGTWAHWQIAAEYASYLSPEFAIAWNDAARSYLQGSTRTSGPVSDIKHVRQLASQIVKAGNAFLEALDFAGRRGAEFCDTVQTHQPLIADFAQVMPDLAHPKHQGFVYLVEEVPNSHALYKIGYTNDLARRLKELDGQTLRKHRYVHYFATDDMRKGEKRLKELYRPYHHKQEWYALAPKQVQLFQQLPSEFSSRRFDELPLLLAASYFGPMFPEGN